MEEPKINKTIEHTEDFNGNMLVGQKVINQGRRLNTPAVANFNILNLLADEDKDLVLMQEQVAEAAQQMMTALGIDTDNDHNTQGTADRLAKMFLHEVYKGRYTPEPVVTDFPNILQADDLYTLGPIDVRSACSHHMVPIMGQAWIGILPSERVIGISKFHRIVEHVMARPQIQEEAAMQIAEKISEVTKTDNVAVIVRAQHMCMTWRGVKAPQNSTMVSSVMEGSFKTNSSLRSEFFNLIKGQGF